jgi:hypothetical protein
MEQIWSLFNLLSQEQKNELKALARKGNNAAEKLIYYLLNDERNEKELCKKLKLSPATFGKVQTQAKDFVTTFFKTKLKSPIGDVQVIQQLILKGEIKTAQKFFTALEKDCTQKQNWQMLDFLYHEGFRLAQMTGDLKFLEDVTDKRSNYIQQYADYVKLYGEVMIEMVRSEKFEERKEDLAAYLKKVNELNKRAYNGGHHALIHNTLLILYHQYSRYYNQPDDTWAVVKKIIANHEQYEKVMNPVTDAIVRINVINFLCIYETYGSPEPLVAEAWKRIDVGGVLAKTNLIYALLGYYLCEENTKAIRKYLAELEKIQDKTHFASFQSVVQAILCFMEKNYTGFKLQVDLFYNDPNHINLPDSEVIVRVLELLVIKNEIREDGGMRQMVDEKHYQSKADALRVYFNRNLNKVRYAEEYDLLSFLITPSKKNREKVEDLNQSKYRNSRMLAKYVLAAKW